MGKRSVEKRQLRPNDNLAADNPPATVGPPPTPRPGDPEGLLIVSEGTPAPWPNSTVRPSPWSGWPAEWETPNWYGRVDDLTDVAWACVDLVASLLATMPPYLVGATRTLDDEWLTNPDPDRYYGWSEFAKQLFWDFQMGEAFVLATARYSTGWPSRFHVVAPWLVNVDADGGGWRYTIGRIDVTDDILHIRYQGSDAHGHGPLEAGRFRMVAARLLNRYLANFVGGGALPSGIITHPDPLSAQQASDLQEQWITARMSTLGLPAVLSGGVEFNPTQQSPSDMGLVDLAQLTESRIAVMLRVPPFLMGLPSGGDSLTYSTTAQLFDYFWRSGLKPRAVPVMEALSGWALPRQTTVELNRDEFIRPGPLERAQTWETLIRAGVMTAEEAREIERLGAAAPKAPLTQGVLQ